MKQSLLRKFLTIIICLAICLSSFAQYETNTEFITRMNYVFAPLEKNRVPNGLLLDYAMEFADLKSYSGVLSDTNKVNKGIVRDLYSTIFMSALHTNAGGFYSPDYIDSIWQIQRQPGIITLSGLYYNYTRFKDNAISSNLITVSNDQLIDKYVSGVWQNPYQTETLFAMTPALHAYSGKSFQVVMPSNLWLTNNAGSVSNIAVNFNDGAGYRVVTMGQAINISYADTGRKTWTFRLTLSNSTLLYSHTEIEIEQEPNEYSGSGCSGCRFIRPGGPIFLTADEAFNGTFGQGWITVDYANADLRLRRPLIVVEGFDPAHIIDPEREFGYTNFNTFTQQVVDNNSSIQLRNLLQGDNQQYDIIYVNWFRGTDFLQRNALLLERVIRWVNEQKVIDGSTEPNVVLGQSMGGVIGRWALRDMENRNLNHQTRLFISWDAPQQGANVPLAYQHAGRHVRRLLVRTAIPLILGGNADVNLIFEGSNLMDVPAARQMLYNRVAHNGSLDNAEHNLWQQQLRNIGYPLLTRNIAVSNGSECGNGQGFLPFATLLTYNGKANTRILTDLIGSFTGVGLGFWGGLTLLTIRPQFLYGILPGRNEFFFDFLCRAQPEGSTQLIYRGKIEFRKKVLWLINVNTTITNRTRNADASVLPIDGTPGGMYDTELNLQNSSFQNWAIKYNIIASNIPHFNFLPTVSALDLGSNNTNISINEFRAGYVGATPPAAPFNTPFANFTTAFNQVAISNGGVNNNENHIQIAARNGNFVAQELNGNINVRTNCFAFCTNGSITGNTKICTSQIITAPFGAGAIYNWTVSNPALVTLTPNGNTVTVTRNGSSNGEATLSVTITGVCGNASLTTPISVGVPEPPSIFPYNFDAQCGTFAEAYSTIPLGTTGHLWNLNYGQATQDRDGNGSNYFYYAPFINTPETGQTYYNYLSVQAKNICGLSDPSPTISLTVGPISSNCDGGGGGPILLRVSPNPTTSTANIEALQNSSFNKLKIMDKFGNIKKEINFPTKTKKAAVSLSGLSTGVYFIKAFDGTKWLTVPFIKL